MMKILKTTILKGPNYWSNFRKKLIVLKIDLGPYEFLPTNKLNNFSNALQSLIPSLYEHRCSPGVNGGFFMRLEEGTWLGHVVEHIALELQCLAGMDCGFGRTFGTAIEGVYQIIFSYEVEEAGLYAVQSAIKIVESLANETNYLTLEQDINTLKELAYSEQYGPSTQSLIDEANKRDIPVSSVCRAFVTLGHGCKQKKIWAAVTSKTSAIGVDLVADKALTKHVLSANFIPVPKGYVVSSIEELEEKMVLLHYPLVIKPKRGNHGRGVTININDKNALYAGFKLASAISEDVIVERYISGDDYRILVVNYKVVAVAKRTPALIIGNGILSIGALINKLNEDPVRGNNHDNFLTSICLDDTTHKILMDKGLNVESILPEGDILHLKNTANLSAGGTAEDMTAVIHPDNIVLAERIARIVELDICGIDLVLDDIRVPLNNVNGAVLEVNAGPGLRMHLSPSQGASRNVAEPVLDMLFPHQDKGRIPIIGVTGTNGKTTVVTLIAKLAQHVGYSVGYTTTEGIYINKDLIHAGDCSGLLSARVVLNDPSINLAVLECARGGILKSGLGFDQCDISIINNITGDHLGLNDIHTLEELARVKGVLAHSTNKRGYCLLNAEDDLTYNLKHELECNIGLFSRVKNQRIFDHCKQGGLAIYIAENVLVLQKGPVNREIMPIKNIPLTFNGTASAMVLNILPVILACYISSISIDSIRKFLYQLHSDAETLPGRMNLFSFDNYKIMVDYAHNEAAFKELQHYLSSSSYDKCIGIIGIAGDRRHEDIINVGALAAELFDEIIIRHDKDSRTLTNEQITSLLMKGISASKSRKVSIISNEFDAVTYAINRAGLNSFIFYGVEEVYQSIDFLKKLQKKNLHPILTKNPVHES